MTGQINDAFHYRDKRFALTSSNGSGLFDPAGQGVVAEAWSTACWRGYYCTYEIVARSLCLTQINLGLDADSAVAAARGEGPKLFGKVPRRYADHYDGSESRDFVVDDLRESIQFTGGLLLVDEFVGEPYFHMGFGMGLHPAYQFHVVHELIFDLGRLVGEHDRSAQMAELRKVIPERVSLAEGEARMKGGFRLDYGFF